MFERYHDVVTVEELGKMLRVGRTAAYALIASGIIPSMRVGRNIRILKSEVIHYFTAFRTKEKRKT